MLPSILRSKHALDKLALVLNVGKPLLAHIQTHVVGQRMSTDRVYRKNCGETRRRWEYLFVTRYPTWLVRGAGACVGKEGQENMPLLPDVHMVYGKEGANIDICSVLYCGTVKPFDQLPRR